MGIAKFLIMAGCSIVIGSVIGVIILAYFVLRAEAKNNAYFTQ